jgi:hypothetical protein
MHQMLLLKANGCSTGAKLSETVVCSLGLITHAPSLSFKGLYIHTVYDRIFGDFPAKNYRTYMF